MNQPNFYGGDFGFDSSNSSSNLTLKFDECEAITETSAGDGGGGSTPTPSSADNNSGMTMMMMMDTTLRDNPVLTTASMPIPTRNAHSTGMGMGGGGNQNFSRLPETDFGLDFDLSQDLGMPQILLMDGTDLNDDSSPTLFGLGQYTDNSSSAMSGTGMHSGLEHSTRPIDVVGTSIRGDYGLSQGSTSSSNNNSSGAQMSQTLQQQQQHLLLSTAHGHQMWGSDTGATNSGHTGFIAKAEPLNLDDDAIYQVDKNDLIQGE